MDTNRLWVQHAREGVVLLPTRHPGVLRLGGRDRGEFLHAYATNDVKGLSPGGGCTSAISSWRGTVTDFVRILARPEDMLVLCSPGRGAVVRKALEKYLIGVDVTLSDVTAAIACIEIVGPQALHLLPAARDLALDAHRTVHFAPALLDLPERDNPLAEAPEPGEEEDSGDRTSALVVRTRGIQGGGVMVLVPHAAEHAMRERLRRLGAVAIGDEAWETVRVAEGIPEFGKDMGEDTNVWEARLDASVSLTKGCYLGQEIVARLRNYDKVQRLLMGLRAPGPDPVAAGSQVVAEDGTIIGTVTSAAPETAEGSVALAMIRAEAARAGAPVRVDGRPGTLADFPYWSNQPV